MLVNIISKSDCECNEQKVRVSGTKRDFEYNKQKVRVSEQKSEE